MSTERIAGPVGTIVVDDGGRGTPPVVLLHSLAGGAGHWRTQLDHLRATRRAVAVNLRGHGDSEPPADGDYDIVAMAADVAAAVTALGLERFALVGHSMGGGVALAYAGLHPDRVERLLLLDAISDGTQLPMEQMRGFYVALESPAYAVTIEEYWATISGPDPAVRARLLADLRATSRETVIGVLRALPDFDPRPALAAYRGPVLAVVTPQNDFPGSLHRVAADMPHQVIEGTGHWIQLDRPEEFNRVLDQFLAGSPSAPRSRSA
jgi:pimeloyl-ACP methyl ester carboxylesterase